MSSAAVTKAVAKKLKYYIDVKRREDGFDLSGPFHPNEDPVPLKAGPTLAYDGLHDRSLKHYFRDPKVKKQIQKMETVNGADSREEFVRKNIDRQMASVCYKLKPFVISPYCNPLHMQKHKPHRPKALMSVDDYMQTKRGSKRRKTANHVVGKPRRILRRSPPQHMQRNEQERLVNMATKLIVATETVALPQQRKQSKSNQTLEKHPSFPNLSRERGTDSHSHSSGTDVESVHDTPRGQKSLPSTPGGGKPYNYRRPKPASAWGDLTRTDSYEDKEHPKNRMHHVTIPGDRDYNSSFPQQMERLHLDGRDDAVVVAPRNMRPKSAVTPRVTEVAVDASTSPRPRSAVHARTATEDEFDGALSKGTSSVWSYDMTDMSTQTVEHRGTQTFRHTSDVPTFDEKEYTVKFTGVPSIKDEDNSDNEKTKQETYGKQSSDTQTQVSSDAQTMETQTRRRDLEPTVVTYEVYVMTGDKLGASTKANIRINIFGEYGSSGERPLLRSKTNRIRFQRGQVDLFALDSVFLGKVINIRIGHDETRLGTGWFLDKVYIKEGSEATRAFEFSCNRWLSARDDDGQIVRDLSCSEVISATHLASTLPKLEERDFDAESQSGSESRSQSRTPSLSDDESVRSEDEDVRSRRDVKSREDEDQTKHVRIQDTRDAKHNARRKAKKEVSQQRFFDPQEQDSRSEEEIEESEEESEKHKRNKKSKSKKSAEIVEEEKNKTSSSSSSSDEENTPELKKEPTPSQRLKHRQHLFKNIARSLSPFMKKTQTTAQDDDDDEKIEFAANVPDDYIAGFMAGIKASEDDSKNKEEVKEKEEEKEKEKEEDNEDEDENEDIQDSAEDSLTESEIVNKKGLSIHEAAASGDLERIKEIMARSETAKTQVNERGQTPLHIASSKGQIHCVKWLAVSGVDLNGETPTGYTPMHLAAMNGHVNCMMVLAAMGSAVSCKTVDECTPLHLAAMSGHVECVKWLLANRANIDVVDNNERTPLDIAEEYGHEEVVALLTSFKKELVRQDSTLSQLMTSEKRRKSLESHNSSDADVTHTKEKDSGVGGFESGDESWVSDHEEEGGTKEETSRPGSGRRSSHTSNPDEPAPINRTDSIVSLQEKKEMYEQQRSKMKRHNSSFLDSIRQVVDNENEDF